MSSGAAATPGKVDRGRRGLCGIMDYLPARAECVLSRPLKTMSILVTGGAGFIGSNFVLDWLAQSDEPVITLDKLTYAGNIANLVSLKTHPGHIFVHGDIGDSALVASLLTRHQPRAILNFAAESHVDRSIYGPGAFIQTNIVGTFNLLEAAREYWNPLPNPPGGISGSCMCPRTKSMGHWMPRRPPSRNQAATNPTAPTRRARQPATIWCAPITIPMDCRS